MIACEECGELCRESQLKLVAEGDGSRYLLCSLCWDAVQDMADQVMEQGVDEHILEVHPVSKNNNHSH